MSSHAHQVRTRPRLRRGLSFLEFVACLAALGGGLAIGSVYLGIDLPKAGEKLLKEAGLVDLLPVDEDALLTAEGEGVEAKPIVPKPRTAYGHPLPPTPDEITLATIRYWNELAAIINEDIAERQDLTARRSETDIYEYLAARQALHQENAEQLEEIETDDVDPRVLAFGIQVRRWHEAGVEVYQNALEIMTDAPTAEVTGPFGQNWRSAATQHRMEENLLTNRLAAIEAFVGHSYPVE